MGAYLRDKNFYYLDLLSNLFNIVSYCKLLSIWILRSKDLKSSHENYFILNDTTYFYNIEIDIKLVDNRKIQKILSGYHGSAKISLLQYYFFQSIPIS